MRKDQSRVGTRKIYLDIQDSLRSHGIKMGRDALFDFMRTHRLLVRKTKRYHITTDSKHGFYKSPNRLKGFTPTQAEQAFVADITYVRVQNDHAYLALVTDLYSKKIMGYKLDTNMRATIVIDALKMALSQRVHERGEIIHHSDRESSIAVRNSLNLAGKTMFCLALHSNTTLTRTPWQNGLTVS